MRKERTIELLQNAINSARAAAAAHADVEFVGVLGGGHDRCGDGIGHFEGSDAAAIGGICRLGTLNMLADGDLGRKVVIGRQCRSF
jgi:hypothetical protein